MPLREGKGGEEARVLEVRDTLGIRVGFGSPGRCGRCGVETAVLPEFPALGLGRTEPLILSIA